MNKSPTKKDAAPATMVDRVVSALPPMPKGFSAAEKKHARNLLDVLVRSKSIDEIAWSVVVRYARHRARWDVLQAEIRETIAAGDLTRAPDKFMSGKEQMLAYHENAMAKIEREFLATPYARLRAGQSAQTDFMDLLGSPKTDTGPRRVVAFKPLSQQR